MNFGEAIEALKSGRMIKRKDWQSFVFRQVPSQIIKDTVPKMQSLPIRVKEEFERRFNSPDAQIDQIYYNDQLAIVNQSNLISGWAPSAADVLAEDWIVLD